MVKRTKGYIAALILVCIIVIAYATNVTKEQESYTFEEGKVSEITEYELSLNEYWAYIEEAMHPDDTVRSQIYFHDEELEKQ